MKGALVRPDWPLPARVRAFTTTRAGGVSLGPYASLNLATHVGDEAAAVAVNRQRLVKVADLPGEPLWLDQIHGTTVVDAGSAPSVANRVTGAIPQADASFTGRPGGVCAVMTADCLPVLLSNREGSEVAAIHAGWRGLAAGVIEATLAAMRSPGSDCIAWLGPAIGPAVYEVGAEVRAALLRGDPDCEAAFQPTPAGRWLANLHQLARRRLQSGGVTEIFGGDLCCYSDTRFYSHRRDGLTGRMASLIWIQ
ncbi:MAG: peptidoglycan editing factor PgeF [Gammaproteobacteria bacterium]|nr:peptidoglycan editing factor PgeF [Gammaproteobacteria bacterium]